MLVLVAVPVLMLGAVSPWAIRLKLRAVEDSGEVAGRMYAISTVGSLVGTFLSALLLIPLVGTQRTFLIFALALALAAVLGLGVRWLPVPALVAALLALPTGTIKAAGEGTVIYETETEYQYARVIERDDGERRLELNEGQAIHSSYRAGTVLTGDYWDGLLVDPVRGARTRRPRRVAMLGNAAGTTARAYGRYFPDTRFDAVEIDGELLDIGRRYFGMGAAPEPAHVQRGRAAVPAPDRRALRRDPRRRLPPALHPVLPVHARVLRARPLPARPGRRGGHQRRAPGALRPPGEGALGDAAAPSSRTSRATRWRTPTRS